MGSVGRGSASQQVGERRCHNLLQPPPPLCERHIPQVRALCLEQVVGDEQARYLGEDLLRDGLAARPLREHRERQQPAVADGEQFAIEHGARRQRGGRGHDLGKGVVHQFLAAAPDGGVGAAANDLGPHAVPLPLGLPRGHVAEVLRHVLDGSAVEGRGEKERIGPPAVGGGRFRREQPREGGGVGR